MKVLSPKTGRLITVNGKYIMGWLKMDGLNK